MKELDLMGRLPKPKRNVTARNLARSPESIAIAREYGAEYFDGSRENGYGGYRYDGRWIPVAEDIVKQFGLKAGDRVLDVGCAKGFLVKDLRTACPGIQAFGLDVSEYALRHCESEVVGYLHLGSAERLPFPDDSFAAVVSKDAIHNLERPLCVQAVREIQRISGGRAFIQVDSYRNPEEREAFLRWVLTAKTYYDPAGWEQLFAEAGYTGYYSWTIID
jgi:ubiquinone/menaquinone biosynthesis C-methylase UbiE